MSTAASPRWESLVAPPSDGPLMLPAAWTPPPRPPLPIVAAIVPVVGAVGLWLITGSIISLWLALLGPVIAVATRMDAARARRRDKRAAMRQWDAAIVELSAEIGARQRAERERRRARHPDIAGFLAREQEIWRSVPGRGTGVAIAQGAVPSGMHVSGGGSDPQSAALRRSATILDDTPIVVAAEGIVGISGPRVPATAVKRALVVQLCLAVPPGDLRIVGPLADEDAWAEDLPHRRAVTGTALALVAPGAPVPPDAQIAVVRAEDASRHPGWTAMLDVTSPARARLDHEGVVRDVRVEAIGQEQARTIAAELDHRAAQLPGARSAAGPVAFAQVVASARAGDGGLRAVVGMDGTAPVALDLVAEGPHAVVAGVTGAGKSELLVTWVLALCAAYSTQEVSFLLADFKGGTAFDALAGLAHVTGVITDLDGTGARRAIESLRAEVRWREAELARMGARDVGDPRVELPRLVIVVDEFAALLGDHPELHAVFTDVAARGRALGMHLILGTQRVSGVVRDALLTNCPLRVSLRVTDVSDSRAVIGTDDAARLPGGVAHAGHAYVRGPADSVPRRLVVALSAPSDIAAISAAPAGPAPRRPWLPDLPLRVALADLTDRPRESGALILGLADEPEQQRQAPVWVRTSDRGVLVTGRAGSGRSTTLRVLATQAERTIVIPADPEGAWDAVAELADNPPQPGTALLFDDVDALVARFPQDYAAEIVDRIERVIRSAGDHGFLVVVSTQRLTGSLGRVLEILPRRVMLSANSRADHIALGGEPAHHSPDQPPGRARLDGRAVQVALPSDAPAAQTAASTATEHPWTPMGRVTGYIARRSAAARAVLAEWEGTGIRIIPVADAADGLPTGERCVIAGDPEEWQRHWQLLGTVRGEHELVIDASCAGEFRALAADRTPPPYCLPGRARGWLCSEGAPAERVVLPGRAREPRQSVS